MMSANRVKLPSSVYSRRRVLIPFPMKTIHSNKQSVFEERFFGESLPRDMAAATPL